MHISAIGTAEDVIGFKLAGSPGAICQTEVDVIGALRAACEDPDVALVIVSGAAADLASAAVRARQSAGPPLVVILR